MTEMVRSHLQNEIKSMLSQGHLFIWNTPAGNVSFFLFLCFKKTLDVEKHNFFNHIQGGKSSLRGQRFQLLEL